MHELNISYNLTENGTCWLLFSETLIGSVGGVQLNITLNHIGYEL